MHINSTTLSDIKPTPERKEGSLPSELRKGSERIGLVV
jgi:hypothetical protein